MRVPVELKHASRLVNHGPTVLVTASHAGRRNVMAAAWSMPVEFTPPRIAVVIDKRTATAAMAAASGTMGLCIPCRTQTDMTYTVGSVSAHDAELAGTDKFERYGIEAFDGPVLGLPMIEGCIAWMECRVIPEAHSQDAYDTWFVEVVSAQADDRVFSGGRWSFRPDNVDLHTIHHLGAGVFAVPSEVIASKILAP